MNVKLIVKEGGCYAQMSVQKFTVERRLPDGMACFTFKELEAALKGLVPEMMQELKDLQKEPA